MKRLKLIVPLQQTSPIFFNDNFFLTKTFKVKDVEIQFNPLSYLINTYNLFGYENMTNFVQNNNTIRHQPIVRSIADISCAYNLEEDDLKYMEKVIQDIFNSALQDLSSIMTLIDEHRFLTIHEYEMNLTYHDKLKDRLLGTAFPTDFINDFCKKELIEPKPKLNNKFPKPSAELSIESPIEKTGINENIKNKKNQTSISRPVPGSQLTELNNLSSDLSQKVHLLNCMPTPTRNSMQGKCINTYEDLF